MDKQAIFDKALAHLRKQGKKAMTGTRCDYRAEDGSMCAVGCLIGDDEYVPGTYKDDNGMEGLTANQLLDKYPHVAKRLMGDDVWTTSIHTFLAHMQGTLHDDLSDWEYPLELERAARRFAASHGLIVRRAA